MSVWSKIYARINWKDLPQRLTALAARNLNKMDLAIDTLDDRTIGLNTRLEAVEENPITVDTELKPDSENPVQNKVIYAAFEDLLPEETAQGNPISINDASGLDAKECTVDFEPIQDLHGYDSPWVGGAGKNKYSIKIGRDSFNDNVGATHSTDNDTLTVVMPSAGNSGVYSRGVAELTKLIGKYNETITYSFDVKSNVGGNINVGYEGYGFKTVTLTTAWQRISITTTATSTEKSFLIYNASGVAQTVEVKDFMFELGSTANNYEPYENICPITGRTSVKLTRTGKNILPVTVANLKARNTGGTWNGNVYTTTTGITFTVNTDSNGFVTSIVGNGTASANTSLYIIPYGTNTLSEILMDGQDYVLNGCTGGSSSTYLVQVQTNSAWFANSSGDTPFTYTKGGTDRARIYVASGATINNAIFYPMIRLAEFADSTYEPYQGETYTETLGQTVYGGKLDLTSGKLTIDSAKETVTAVTRNNNTSFYYVPISAPDRVFNHIISNKMKTSASYGAKGVFLNSSGAVIFATEDEYSTASAMISAFGGSIDVCFTLATPIEITLTAEQISLLKGNNVLSTDGDNIILKYSADIKAWVENQLSV